MAYFRCGGGPIQQAGGSVILASNPTITVTKDKPNQVTITWSKPSSEVTIDHYNCYIYKSDTAPTSLKQFTLVSSISNQLTYTINGLSTKSTYYFVVTSVTEANYENASIKNKKSMYFSEVFALIRGGSKWYSTPDFVNYTAVSTPKVNALVSYSPYKKCFYSLVPNTSYTYEFAVVNEVLTEVGKIPNPTWEYVNGTQQSTCLINSAFSYMLSSDIFCGYDNPGGTTVRYLNGSTWANTSITLGYSDELISIMGRPTGFNKSDGKIYMGGTDYSTIMYKIDKVCETLSERGYVAIGRSSSGSVLEILKKDIYHSASFHGYFPNTDYGDCIGLSSNKTGDAICAIGNNWIAFTDGTGELIPNANSDYMLNMKYGTLGIELASNIIYSEAGNCFFAMGTDYVYKIPASSDAINTTTWETYELPSDIKSSYSSSKTPAIVTT